MVLAKVSSGELTNSHRHHRRRREDGLNQDGPDIMNDESLSHVFVGHLFTSMDVAHDVLV